MADSPSPKLVDQLAELEPEQIMTVFTAAMIVQSNALLQQRKIPMNGRHTSIHMVINGKPGKPRRDIHIIMKVQDA